MAKRQQPRGQGAPCRHAAPLARHRLQRPRFAQTWECIREGSKLPDAVRLGLRTSRCRARTAALEGQARRGLSSDGPDLLGRGLSFLALPPPPAALLSRASPSRRRRDRHRRRRRSASRASHHARRRPRSDEPAPRATLTAEVCPRAPATQSAPSARSRPARGSDGSDIAQRLLA